MNTQSRPIAAFNELCCYFHNPAILLWRSIEVAVTQRVLARLPSNGRVLDIGCAEGTITGILFPDTSVVGVDPWLAALQDVPSRHAKIGGIQADARCLPFRAASFALVFSNSVVEHIVGLDAVLDEVCRVVVPGGRFVFTVPTAGLTDAYSLTWLLHKSPLGGIGRRYADFRNSQLAHHNLLDKKGWEEVLGTHGFELEDFEPYLPSWIVHIWDVMAALCWLARPARRLPAFRAATELLTESLVDPGIRGLIQRAGCDNREACAAVIVARAPKARDR